LLPLRLVVPLLPDCLLPLLLDDFDEPETLDWRLDCFEPEDCTDSLFLDEDDERAEDDDRPELAGFAEDDDRPELLDLEDTDDLFELSEPCLIVEPP